MNIPDSVWENSETWKEITACPQPLWCDFGVAERALNCSRPLWNDVVAFVRHYQNAPDGDKEAISKGHIPPSALSVG